MPHRAASPVGEPGEERRDDLAPLLKRFDALGTPTSAAWYSGTLGDPDVPGPSSYWIDAVVKVEPKDAEDLATTYAAEPTDTRPRTVESFAGDVPDGELLRSPQLDRAFSTQFSTQVWAESATGTVVLNAKGQ